MDSVYRADPGVTGRAFTNSELIPFLRFVCEIGTHARSLILFGRADPGGHGADYEIPGPVEIVPLPYYSNLVRAFEVIRAAPGTLLGFWRGLGRVDVVIVFGPYPFSLFLVAFGLLRGKRVVLGVRQDTMSYFRSRLPSALASPVLAPIWLIDRAYRLLSRRLPTLVVGGLLEHQYGGPRDGLTLVRPSLVRATEVVRSPPSRDYSATVQLLTVGRIEAEKNPLLLVDALAELTRTEPRRYRLRWVGEGRLLESAKARARERGVEDAIEWLGFVPFGPELLRIYREAQVFVHVAITEAFGQVLAESMACGLPIVATDVGGVSAALNGGAAGLLVPPSTVTSLVAAIQRMSGDPGLRETCVAAGLELARRHSLEAEAARVAELAQLP